jgi:hypothetical protein
MHAERRVSKILEPEKMSTADQMQETIDSIDMTFGGCGA